ncbi:hypothetical protein P7K49_015159 [Saguinus oedipus]|uniref:Uncharacterized protein n=1 Tax=Saguinus oedipus TaxID=9490 RepID=A0ABQ9V993_SAGOE|nr:hypothetical protein P7K49_015159 [Saguinus oedipus]
MGGDLSQRPPAPQQAQFGHSLEQTPHAGPLHQASKRSPWLPPGLTPQDPSDYTSRHSPWPSAPSETVTRARGTPLHCLSGTAKLRLGHQPHPEQPPPQHPTKATYSPLSLSLQLQLQPP